MKSQPLQPGGRPINSFLFEFNYMQKPWTQSVVASSEDELDDSVTRIDMQTSPSRRTGTEARNDDRERLKRRKP